MGRQFYDEFTVFRQTIEEASDALGLNLKGLLFDGPESDLTLTENAQPAILAVSIGCFRVAEQELGLKTKVNLGHSLGEYSALVACEAIPFAHAVRWVRARGQAMQKAVPVGEGTMSAVIGAEDSQVEEWCRIATENAKISRKERGPESSASSEAFSDTFPVTFTVAPIVHPANFNAPGQIVVSGSVDAIGILEKNIQNTGIRGVMVKRLPVSAPFHSSLMKPAREVMEGIFQKAAKGDLLSALQTPYIPNRTAKITGESGVVFELLAEQVDHSVLWKQSVETLFESGCKVAFEFGPGKVLQGLAKRIAKPLNATFETYPIYDLESLKTAEGAAKA